MPLEVRCAGCGKLLRVADEHAGKPLRCPACNHISTAPAAPSAVAPAPAGWYMRTPEGQTYGPVGRDELDRWVVEGRLAAECSLAQSDGGPWEPAAATFPALMLQAPRPRPSPTVAPPTFQPAPPFGAPRFQTPHRGGLILVLGLLGLVVNCPIFSLMAWVMGSHDLREMQAGRMDKSGEGLTQAGQILGMILSGLWIVVAVVIMLFVLVAAVAGN